MIDPKIKTDRIKSGWSKIMRDSVSVSMEKIDWLESIWTFTKTSKSELDEDWMEKWSCRDGIVG